MSYESKLYIVEQSNDCNRIIGNYDLCKLREDFEFDIFDKELEGKIIVNNKEVNKDAYGEHLRYCDDLSMLIAELKHEEKLNHYRRLKPIIAMLKEFEKLKDEFNHLIIVHYGH